MSDKLESPSPPAAAATSGDPGLVGEFETEPGFDGHDDDNDSALGDGASIQTSTASLNSTILNYRKLHGRTYHNFDGAEYWGPNDDTQNEQLDIAHHMMTLAFDNKLFLAPLENPQKVLDVGTGTGIWAVDFADEFPASHVIGIDLSPIQPHWVPPNCTFELDNCELNWTYPDEHFDYIHIRGLVGCIKDWKALYRECLRCLKPGGWLEQTEFALPMRANIGELPEDSIYHTWGKVFLDAGDKMGRSFLVADHCEEWMREAGFSSNNMHSSAVKLPIGGWPSNRKWKEVGLFNRLSLEQGLEGFASYLCTMVLGWQADEITVLMAKMRQVLNDKSQHVYYSMKTVYVQKQ